MTRGQQDARCRLHHLEHGMVWNWADGSLYIQVDTVGLSDRLFLSPEQAKEWQKAVKPWSWRDRWFYLGGPSGSWRRNRARA